MADAEALATARHLTALFGQIARRTRGHEGASAEALLADASELDAHVSAGWLEEQTRREGDSLVRRYRVLTAGWRAIDDLLEEAAHG